MRSPTIPPICADSYEFGERSSQLALVAFAGVAATALILALPRLAMSERALRFGSDAG
jgi:hypothetical protein